MKIQTKTTQNIMNAFLSGKPLKRKHIRTNGTSIMLDDQKLVFKCAYSSGKTNIKVNSHFIDTFIKGIKIAPI